MEQFNEVAFTFNGTIAYITSPVEPALISLDFLLQEREERRKLENEEGGDEADDDAEDDILDDDQETEEEEETGLTFFICPR